MAWVGVVTNAGVELFATYAQSGQTLSINSVKTGTGTKASTTAMKEATELVSLKDTGVVESKAAVSGGLQVKMRVHGASGTVGAYTMKEMGLFVDATSGGTTTTTMVAYFNNSDGVDIPLMSSFPDFVYALTSVLAISNDVEISLTVDTTAIATVGELEEAVQDLEDQIAEKKSKQTAVNDPTASGTGISFIDSISQDADGIITPTKKTVRTMGAATAGAAGTSGLVPAPEAGKQGMFLRGDGTWASATYSVVSKTANGLCPQLPNETSTTKFLRQDGTWIAPPGDEYHAGTGLSLNDSTKTFSLQTSGAASGSYGPTADVSGSNGTTLKVPYITVDAYGRITSITEKTYTSVNTTYTAGTGLTLTGTAFSLTASGATAGSYGPSADVTGNNGNTIKVPYITVDQYGRITSVSEKTYTSVNTDTNTTYSAGTGLALNGTTFSLGTSGVTAGSYGPSENVTGNNGTTINVPYITVDAYGRITSITNKVYTSVDNNSTGYLPLSGGTVTGVTSFTNTTASSSTTTGAVKISGGLGVGGYVYGSRVYGAVWNDYAEYREAETVKPGYCVTECEDGIMKKTTGRLQAGCRITSDTFGFCIGETDKAKTSIAVAGRVLAYPWRNKEYFKLGAAVCSAPDGMIDIMTREEIKEYPERIIGTVSEIPNYEIWDAGTKENPKPIEVNGRIWIYVR